MIWIILYVLIASVAVFGLSFAKRYIRNNVDRSIDSDMMIPVLCGTFWFVAAPIYGAYLAAIWFSERR